MTTICKQRLYSIRVWEMWKWAMTEQCSGWSAQKVFMCSLSPALRCYPFAWQIKEFVFSCGQILALSFYCRRWVMLCSDNPTWSSHHPLQTHNCQWAVPCPTGTYTTLHRLTVGVVSEEPLISIKDAHSLLMKFLKSRFKQWCVKVPSKKSSECNFYSKWEKKEDEHW